MVIDQRIADHGYYWNGDKPAIFATWHGRMFIPVYYFRNSGLHVLVSEHQDGEIVTAAFEYCGHKTVRGSTTRGGAKALARLVRLAKKGASIAITPDGPRGPRCRFQPGAVYLAAKTGLPVVPITGSAKHAYYFKSWDSFQFPFPFSRGVMAVDEPYFVTGGLEPDNIEFHRAELERRLIELTRKADEISGVLGEK